MFKIFILFLLLVSSLYSNIVIDRTSHTDDELKKLIGSMIVMGFEGEAIEKESEIYRAIVKYDLGGVILFDRYYSNRKKVKNIRDPKQLKKLTAQLQAISTKPLIISVDQEGGRVARLKNRYGFAVTPSAAEVGRKNDPKYARNIYHSLAKTLSENGINCDFAPVVDLSINPANKVIYQLERSFGESPEKVVKYAGIFMETLKSEGVISVLKHFPGHGSSLGDSHEGFVDVTETWQRSELEPYAALIDEKRVGMIMTAHVFNAQLDPKYPATLSYAVNTSLLRQKMNYDGVLISDDLQMKAISKHYTLPETVTLAINSGVDILLFGNQLGAQNIDELINVIFEQVKSGEIEFSRIIESNRRIDNLSKIILHQDSNITIIDRPIDFGEARIQMTKEYILQHYGLKVKDITIEPKVIVLHWTAVDNLEDSFNRLQAEELFSDRKDIASAGALNVSAHFIVDRDGTIYRLMPETRMARHVIGLNYSSIGIENIGGKDNVEEDLTDAQVKANIALVKYLKKRFNTINYLIGHHEYRLMEKTPLWLEKDAGYRTTKSDPGEKFMQQVRSGVKALNLKIPPKTK